MEAEELAERIHSYGKPLPGAVVGELAAEVEYLTGEKAPLRLPHKRAFVENWVSDHLKTSNAGSSRPSTAPSERAEPRPRVSAKSRPDHVPALDWSGSGLLSAAEFAAPAHSPAPERSPLPASSAGSVERSPAPLRFPPELSASSASSVARSPVLTRSLPGASAASVIQAAALGALAESRAASASPAGQSVDEWADKNAAAGQDGEEDYGEEEYQDQDRDGEEYYEKEEEEERDGWRYRGEEGRGYGGEEADGRRYAEDEEEGDFEGVESGEKVSRSQGGPEAEEGMVSGIYVQGDDLAELVIGINKTFEQGMASQHLEQLALWVV